MNSRSLLFICCYFLSTFLVVFLILFLFFLNINLSHYRYIEDFFSYFGKNGKLIASFVIFWFFAFWMRSWFVFLGRYGNFLLGFIFSLIFRFLLFKKLFAYLAQSLLINFNVSDVKKIEMEEVSFFTLSKSYINTYFLNLVFKKYYIVINHVPYVLLTNKKILSLDLEIYNLKFFHRNILFLIVT